MKILCFIDSLVAGGAQRQLVNLALSFSKFNYEVDFLLYKHDDFYLPSLMKNGNIKVFYVEDKVFWRRALKIRKFIRGGNYDVVLSFLVRPSFIAELASFPTRKWKLFVGERSADPRIVTILTGKYVRWFHLFADKVIANSYKNVELVKKACPFLKSSKFEVVYNSFDITKFDLNENYFFKKDGKLHILVAASYRYLKNLRGLIEAVNKLPLNLRSMFVIDWYGSDWIDDSKIEDQKLIEEYSLNDVIRLHSETTRIGDIMSLCDVVALFSTIEGFPNAICEGMLYGKPILCSNVSDIPLIVEDNVNGFLFDPLDINSIVLAFIKLLETKDCDLKIMGEKNREKSLNMFSEETITQQYIKIFNS